MRHDKFRFIISITIFVVSVFIAVGVGLAWYIKQYKISTGTKVEVEHILYIGAGHQDNIAEFSFGKIDATDDSKYYMNGEKKILYKNYVFCVIEEKRAQAFKVQIAHTTNLDFKYKILAASELASEPASMDEDIAVYSSLTGTYYYEGSEVIVDTIDAYHITPASSVYGEYTYVHPSAHAQYYQSNELEPTEEELLTKGLVRYFVFQIYWEDGTIENNKETDIVYITAEQTS